MAKKVLSIEVGESITRVVELDYMAKTPRIYNAFCFETPQDTISEDGVRVNEDIIGLMKQGLRQKGIRTNKVVFTISSTRIANRDITIPAVKENKIKQVLLANSKDYFPVDMSQYELVFRVEEQLKEEKQLKLAVLAVPRSLIASYIQLARVWGFQIIGMDYSGNSAYQALMRSVDPALSIAIHVDDTSSMLTVIKGGRLEFQRTVGYGIDSAVEAVRSSRELGENLSYLDALAVMQNKSCFNQELRAEVETDDWGELEDDAIMNVRGEATRAMAMFINNITRVLDYYTSKNQDLEIEKIWLTGPGAECRGLDKLLANELGLPVSPLKDTKAISLSRALLRGKFRLSEYMTVVGASFNPLNISTETEGGKQSGSEAGGSKDSMLVPILVLAASVVASAVLVGLPYLANVGLETANKLMRQQIEQKKWVVDIYNTYVVQKKTYDRLAVFDRNTNAPNDVILELFADMEEKLPSDFTVDSLSVQDDTVTITARCLTRESVAETIMQLRTFEMLLDVTCGAVSEEESDSGVLEQHFTLTLTYFPRQEQEESNPFGEGAESTEDTEGPSGGAGTESTEDTKEPSAGADTEDTEDSVGGEDTDGGADEDDTASDGASEDAPEGGDSGDAAEGGAQ